MAKKNSSAFIINKHNSGTQITNCALHAAIAHFSRLLGMSFTTFQKTILQPCSLYEGLYSILSIESKLMLASEKLNSDLANSVKKITLAAAKKQHVINVSQNKADNPEPVEALFLDDDEEPSPFDPSTLPENEEKLSQYEGLYQSLSELQQDYIIQKKIINDALNKHHQSLMHFYHRIKKDVFKQSQDSLQSNGISPLAESILQQFAQWLFYGNNEERIKLGKNEKEQVGQANQEIKTVIADVLGSDNDKLAIIQDLMASETFWKVINFPRNLKVARALAGIVNSALNITQEIHDFAKQCWDNLHEQDLALVEIQEKLEDIQYDMAANFDEVVIPKAKKQKAKKKILGRLSKPKP